MISCPAGIPCHEEEPGEPCGCNQSQCGNPSGRYRSSLFLVSYMFPKYRLGVGSFVKGTLTRFKASLHSIFYFFQYSCLTIVFFSQVRPDNSRNAFCWGENGNCLPWMRRNNDWAVNNNDYLAKLVKKRGVKNTRDIFQSRNTKLRTNRMSFCIYWMLSSKLLGLMTHPNPCAGCSNLN